MAEPIALDRYWERLLHLEALCAAGAGESAQAEALRDEMDAAWRGMTAAEHDELRRRLTFDVRARGGDNG